jgi:hypothetical protein
MYCAADVSAKRPNQIYYFNAQGGNFNVYDVQTKELKKLARHEKLGATDMSMTWYPEKDTFLCFPCSERGTSSKIYEYNPASNAWTVHATEGDAPNTYSINVAYDALNKVFACFSDGYFHYYSPPQNKWYKLPQKFEIKRLFHHHIYDPVDNVHLAVGGRWETYAFKLSDEPGKLPGTGLSSK